MMKLAWAQRTGRSAQSETELWMMVRSGSALDEGRGAALFAEDCHEAGAADAAISAAGNFDQAFLNAGGEQDVGGIEFVVWK